MDRANVDAISDDDNFRFLIFFALSDTQISQPHTGRMGGEHKKSVPTSLVLPFQLKAVSRG